MFKHINNPKYILIFSLLIILACLIVMKIYKIIEAKENNNKLYYFDNNATTCIYDKRVLDEIYNWINCGNPSNDLHIAGIVSRKKIEDCRKIIADDLQVEPDELLFTGNATEANNIIIQGIINKYLEKTENISEKYTIITTNFEHPSVLKVFDHYKTNPRIHTIIVPIRTDPEDPYFGSIDPTDIEKAIVSSKYKVILLSVMYANNETGAIQNMDEIGKIAKKHDVFLHSDVTQAIGKFIIHPNKLNIDSITFSGHKFHAPKGIGCLYMRKQCNIHGLCYGGEQEQEYRPGTENTAFIAAIAMALKISHFNREQKTKDLYRMRKYLKSEFDKMDVVSIDSNYGVLPNTLLVVLKGIDTCNKEFARKLSTEMHVCVGVSSACQTKKKSHVLDALRVNKKNMDKIVRISLSDYTTDGECIYLVNCFKDFLEKHRKNIVDDK